MAFLPGIFGKSPAPAPAPQPAAGGPAMAQQAAPANPAAAPAQMTGQPQQAPVQTAEQAPANPMDAFKDLFKPRAVDPNAVQQPTMADPILSPLDPTAFKQQVASANFTGSIPQDTIQKAMGGDAQAFSDAINMAAREAFAAAAQLSHGLVEHGSRTAAERLNSSLDSRVRNIQIKSQNTSNEALQHPAVAPMMQAVKMQLAQSNPQLSPDQVQAQAEQYFTQMADVLTAPKKQAEQAATRAKSAEPDFSYLLS